MVLEAWKVFSGAFLCLEGKRDLKGVQQVVMTQDWFINRSRSTYEAIRHVATIQLIPIAVFSPFNVLSGR
jgi:hypothetical protein